MTKSSTLSLHLCNSLYQEIVVDGPPSPDKQGVINFIRVLEWRLSNTITDEEFSHLYKIWVSSQNQLGKHKDPLSKKEMRELLHHKTELELLGMLGLLVRENNYTLLQGGHSAAWCKAIESLFWSLDHSGRGYASQDEILFLLLAIVGNPTESEEGNNSNKVTVGMVQQHTFQLMKEFQASNGIVTLRHFKSYFHRNNLDLEAVHRSITSLSTLLSSVSKNEQLPEYQIAVPKLWEQAIYQAIDFIHESFAQSEDANAWGVVDFLSADAFELRFGFNSEKPHWKLSLLLFKEFTMMYGYVSPIEYTKDSIFNDQNFMLIQHTLRFYDELLTEILEKLFPSNDNSNIIEPVEIQSSEIVPYNEEDPPEKLALGEYTPEQVTRWLASANWVDVLVNTEHDIDVYGASKSTVLDYVDTDIPSQVEHFTPTHADNLTKSQGNTKSGMFNSGIAVENITPTYLQSIFNTTPKSKHQPVIQKPTKKTSKVAAQPLQGDLLPDTKIIPIGVVPISKIPHKENMKGKKR